MYLVDEEGEDDLGTFIWQFWPITPVSSLDPLLTWGDHLAP